MRSRGFEALDTETKAYVGEMAVWFAIMFWALWSIHNSDDF